MKCKCYSDENKKKACQFWKLGVCRFHQIGYKQFVISPPIKLNGFNNGRDATEGIGGSPGPFDEEFLDRVENAVTVLKTMLRVSKLKVGQKVAEELIQEIQERRKHVRK